MLKKLWRKLGKRMVSDLRIETYFNVPFKFRDAGEYAVNERIVEVPFVLSLINGGKENQKILDFGCTRSWISLSLASLGHRVYGIDLRDYPFEHENLVFNKQDILEFNEKNFDIVIAVSSLEHVGLGAYGEENKTDGIEQVLEKMNELLIENGTLIITVPVGQPSVDPFMRSFAPDEIKELVTSKGFLLEDSRYFKRKGHRQWSRCQGEDMHGVSNREAERRKTGFGANGVGCFVFRKQSGPVQGSGE
jgi:hypothetical protein